MGTNPSHLIVLPSRNVILAGHPMGNSSDHMSMVNVCPFGRCKSLAYPPTASATAAAHGKLTPMPCVPGTYFNWVRCKDDVLICDFPSLTISSKCKCVYGGTISLQSDGQTSHSCQALPFEEPLQFEKKVRTQKKKISLSLSSSDMPSAETKQISDEEEKRWIRAYEQEISKCKDEFTKLHNWLSSINGDDSCTIFSTESEENNNYTSDDNSYYGETTDEEGNRIILGKVVKSNLDNVSIDLDENTPDLSQRIVSILPSIFNILKPIKNTKLTLTIELFAGLAGAELQIAVGYDNNRRLYLGVEFLLWVGIDAEFEAEIKGKKLKEIIGASCRKLGKKYSPVKIDIKYTTNEEQPVYDWIETSLFADINLNIHDKIEINYENELDTQNCNGQFWRKEFWDGEHSIDITVNLPNLETSVKWDPKEIENGFYGFSIESTKDYYDGECPKGRPTRNKAEKHCKSIGLTTKFGPNFKYTWQLQNLIDNSYQY